MCNVSLNDGAVNYQGARRGGGRSRLPISVSQLLAKRRPSPTSHVRTTATRPATSPPLPSEVPFDRGLKSHYSQTARSGCCLKIRAGGGWEPKLVNLPIPKETQAEYAQSRDTSVMLWLGVCILGLRWMLGMRQRICVLGQLTWVFWQRICVVWPCIWVLLQRI